MIVITTPTGQIGHEVLEQILQTEQDVRTIVRDPERVPEALREKVEVISGSHADPEVLGRAFDGADTLFWLVPPNPRTENILDHYLDFTRPAVEAIEHAGVARVVAVSSLGRGYGKDAGLLSPAFAMDDLIESTGVAYRSLGMSSFMDNLLGQIDPIKDGAFFMANSADRPLSTIATRDIATVAVSLLIDDSWTGQEVVPVVGPDALSPDEMAKTMTEVLGWEVGFQQVPLDRFRDSFVERGLTLAWATGLTEMAAAQNDGIYDLEVAAATPRLTSFRQWCEEVLAPAVAARR